MCPVSCRQRQPNKGRQKGRLRPFCRPYTWKIVPISNVVLFRYDQISFFYDAKFFFGLECVSDNSKKSFKKNISRFFFQKKIRSKSSKISRKKISMKKSLFSRLWVFLNYFSPLITFRMVKKLKLVPENIYFSFNLCWHFSPCIHFLAFFRPFWTSFGWFQPNFVDLLSAFV